MTLCAEPSDLSRAYATTYVTNSGADEVEITDVSLVDPVDLSEDGAWLLPDDATGFPTGGVVPPAAGESELSEIWNLRVPAKGATIAPGETRQVVHAATLHSSTSGFARLRLAYRNSWRSAEAEDQTRVAVVGAGPHCNAAEEPGGSQAAALPMQGDGA